MKKRRAYVAGPMRNFECFNFPAFDKAAAHLRADGWEVYCPAEHDRDCGFDETLNCLDGFDMEQAARWDIQAILKSDAIYMLDGWEKSTGASLELQIARWIGIEVLYESEPSRLSVSEEAHMLVSGPRNADYCHPYVDFTATGRIWGAILGQPDISPEMVGLCMIGLKLSRESRVHKRDNLVDAAGYAECVDLIAEYQDSLVSSDE